MRCDPTETRAVHRLKQQSRGPANGSAEGFVRALAGARRRQGDAHAAGEWWAGSGRRLVVEGERVESDGRGRARVERSLDVGALLGGPAKASAIAGRARRGQWERARRQRWNRKDEGRERVWGGAKG